VDNSHGPEDLFLESKELDVAGETEAMTRLSVTSLDWEPKCLVTLLCPDAAHGVGAGSPQNTPL
jgi:hypothetical protein